MLASPGLRLSTLLCGISSSTTWVVDEETMSFRKALLKVYGRFDHTYMRCILAAIYAFLPIYHLDDIQCIQK